MELGHLPYRGLGLTLRQTACEEVLREAHAPAASETLQTFLRSRPGRARQHCVTTEEFRSSKSTRVLKWTCLLYVEPQAWERDHACRVIIHDEGREEPLQQHMEHVDHHRCGAQCPTSMRSTKSTRKGGTKLAAA